MLPPGCSDHLDGSPCPEGTIEPILGGRSRSLLFGHSQTLRYTTLEGGGNGPTHRETVDAVDQNEKPTPAVGKTTAQRAEPPGGYGVEDARTELKGSAASSRGGVSD